MRWCSECGAEHEDWVSACALCGASLLDQPPAPDARVGHPLVDHTLGALDVGALGPDQRSRLTMVLASRQVPFELVGAELRFPESRRADAEAAVTELRDANSGTDSDGDTDSDMDAGVDTDRHPDRTDRRGKAAAMRLASTGHRVAAELVGALLWGTVLTVARGVADQLGVASYASSLGAFVVVTLVNVTLVSRIGADPGKLVLGLRVVDSDDVWPRWGQALLRATVLFGPYWALGLGARVVWQWDRGIGQALAWAPLVWVGLVVWSIAHDPQRQGWHDRVARTWVVRRRANR